MYKISVTPVKLGVAVQEAITYTVNLMDPSTVDHYKLAHLIGNAVVVSINRCRDYNIDTVKGITYAVMFERA